MPPINRRFFLLGGAATLGGVALAAAPSWLSSAAEPTISNPFQLGIASGDPLPTSVVLWTRLAPKPLNGDGLGGMPNATFAVGWEVSSNEQFSSIVASGTFSATQADAHSVHVIANGLQPDSWYYYRFKVQAHISPVGRTRTAPALTAAPSSMKLAFTSCQRWEQGWYHAHQAIANDSPDLVLFLGDYIYEYTSTIYGSGRNAADVRATTMTEVANNLARYRQRYAQHHTDPQLKMAHAAAPWVSIMDDHEVANNWAGGDTGASPNYGGAYINNTQRAAAFKAWWENVPTRIPAPSGAAIASYQRFQWGTLARFHMLDTRQFRSEQSPPGSCSSMRSTTRSIMGTTQEQWLLSGFDTQPCTWDILGQQVFFASRDSDGNAATCTDLSNDAWDGYDASRKRITQGWVDRGIRNPIVLTGDVHRPFVANVLLDYYAGGAPVGTELVTSSVSSYGSDTAPDLSGSPHVRYLGNKRGYVRCQITPDATVAEFMGVSSVSTRDFNAVSVTPTRTYTIVEGQPGVAL